MDGQLSSLTEIATANVEAAVGAPLTPAGKKTIAAEINRIEGQLSLMVADVQNTYEQEKLKLENGFKAATSAYSYVKSNRLFVAGVLLAAYALGVLTKAFL